jgi:hypothetical protein
VQSGELWPDKLHHNLSLTQATIKKHNSIRTEAFLFPRDFLSVSYGASWLRVEAKTCWRHRLDRENIWWCITAVATCFHMIAHTHTHSLNIFLFSTPNQIINTGTDFTICQVQPTFCLACTSLRGSKIHICPRCTQFDFRPRHWLPWENFMILLSPFMWIPVQYFPPLPKFIYPFTTVLQFYPIQHFTQPYWGNNRPRHVSSIGICHWIFHKANLAQILASQCASKCE